LTKNNDILAVFSDFFTLSQAQKFSQKLNFFKLWYCIGQADCSC